MSNTYTKPSDLVAGTTARAGDINDRAGATETGFDNVEAITNRSIKLPAGTSGDQLISESASNRANKEVGFNASGALTLISSAFQWKGNWATSTAYIKNDTVKDNSTKNIYAVLVDHTSGTLSSDVSAAKLALAINVADVETAKTAAQTAQAAAETAETNAETAETNAETAETNAETAETNATAQAVISTAKAVIATTKASEAATSASAGATSATAAASSATASASSATAGATSATNSANSATASASSASTATTKASEASTSASTATTKASEASTSASTASTQASTATTKASEASTSAGNAATSATAAAASYGSFDDRFLGSKSSGPNVDNDGASLLTGAMYWDTSASAMKVYSGSAWVAMSPSAADQALINIVGGELTATEDLGSIASAITTSTGNNISIVGGAITNINTVAGAVANVNSVAGNSTNINSAVSNATNINSAVSNAANINSAVSNAANINLAAGSITNVNLVGGSIANVNTVGGAIADVNRYANEYKISSSAPAGPSSGDLWYDSTANTLKYYTGSVWASIAAGIASLAADTSPQLGGALDGQNNNMTNIGTVSGSNLQLDFGGLT